MRTLVSIITSVLFLTATAQAQLVFNNQQQAQKDMLLKKSIEPKAAMTFQLIEEEAQVENYASVCKKITYPEQARENGIEGNVQVQVFVNESGDVEAHQVYGKHQQLNREVEKYLYELSFRPAKYQGQAVAAWTSLKFSFKLTE